MKLTNGVLVCTDEDMKYIQSHQEVGMSVAEALREEAIDMNGFQIEEIEAIKFNPKFFYLSSQLILALPKLRLMMKQSLV